MRLYDDSGTSKTLPKRPASNQPGIPSVSALPSIGTPQVQHKSDNSTLEEYKYKGNAQKTLVDSAYMQIHPSNVMPNNQGVTDAINILEEQIKSVANRQSYLVEEERANRQRIESALKISNEQTALVVNDLASKVASLESLLCGKNDSQSELFNRLRQAELNNKELENYIKSIQYQSDKEISELRNALNEKFNEDSTTNSKNKEKNAALFSEVVRLGQEFEKLSENLHVSISVLDTKINQVDSRIEKTTMEFSNNESTSNNFTELLAKYSERNEARLNQFDTQLTAVIVFFSCEKFIV